MFNVYNFFTSVDVGVIMGNNDTLSTQNNGLQMYTSCNEDLQNAWTNFDPSTDPNNPIWIALKAVLPPAQGGTASGGNDKAFDAFVQKYLTGTTTNLYNMSSGLCILMMNACMYNWSTDSGSPSSSDMNVVNQTSSVVSSSAQNDEQATGNIVKSLNSNIQAGSNVQQTIADMGTTVAGIAGNTAGLLQQGY